METSTLHGSILLQALTPDDAAELIADKVVLKLKPLIPAEKEPDELLTRAETAKLLKISLPTLHDWTRTGKLQSYRISSRLRYRKSEVIEALESRQAKKPNRR
ncbi:MAG TPA: helix-turn-helix domain-containing protein [Bacteroidales bacterium]|nr:helix-turn-helix domain-containing protein [Bacteroidales bacterium]HPI84879.1 helix-turn-helix domain-containing protein [Bacteroidales bacterium]